MEEEEITYKIGRDNAEHFYQEKFEDEEVI